MSAVHICSAPGCVRHATRPCFDCGDWRCEEHLLAAVHHRKAAIVHLCPACLQAHADHPERLRIEGFEDERAERARDPLAPRETPREQITPLENNHLASPLTPARTADTWRLERELTSPSAKRVTDHLMARGER